MITIIIIIIIIIMMMMMMMMMMISVAVVGGWRLPGEASDESTCGTVRFPLAAAPAQLVVGHCSLNS